MKTVTFCTAGRFAEVAKRLEAEGYDAMLVGYEFRDGLYAQMEWNRLDHVADSIIRTRFSLVEDGDFHVDVTLSGLNREYANVECCTTRDVEFALEQAALCRGRFEDDIAKAAA